MPKVVVVHCSKHGWGGSARRAWMGSHPVHAHAAAMPPGKERQPQPATTHHPAGAPAAWKQKFGWCSGQARLGLSAGCSRQALSGGGGRAPCQLHAWEALRMPSRTQTHSAPLHLRGGGSSRSQRAQKEHGKLEGARHRGASRAPARDVHCAARCAWAHQACRRRRRHAKVPALWGSNAARRAHLHSCASPDARLQLCVCRGAHYC